MSEGDVFAWALLPAELQLLILEKIALQKHRRWSQCAAVCKEWQAFIEPKNFYRLQFAERCKYEPNWQELRLLAGLEDFEPRYRPLVHHFSNDIEFPLYGRRVGDYHRHDLGYHFGMGVSKLFSLLRHWKPTGHLVLELSAFSRSDREHGFDNYCFGPGYGDTGEWTQQEKDIRRAAQDGIMTLPSCEDGWVNGEQIEAPEAPALMRLFSPIPSSDFLKHLPEVQAVTGFLIRRQFRNEVFPEVLKAVWEKLPRLESIHYELWRVQVHHSELACANELASLIQDTPKHVKTISIFKDFDNQLERILSQDPTHVFRDEDTTSADDVTLAKAFATKTDILERLSISFMIDAQQFFTSCQQLSCTWNNLQLLTLTSSTLSQTVPRDHIDTMLQNASLTALNMPQLKSMVLWNGDSGEACAMIYQRYIASGSASLTWRGTWDLDFSQDVVEAWKKVVPGSSCLRIKKEVRDAYIRSHGDAIHHLRLPDGVIDPASLWQIRHEGRMQWIV